MQYRRGFMPVIKIILIINVVMFVLCYFADKKFNINTSQIFGLHQIQSQYWGPWQYITHMFMHGGIEHIFFNMFALYMFGNILEQVWGGKRFLIYYFVTGLGAAFLNNLITSWDLNGMNDALEAFQNTPTPALFSDFVEKYLGSNASDGVYSIINGWTSNPQDSSYIETAKTICAQITQLRLDVPTIGASGAVFGVLLAFGMLFPNTELFLLFFPFPIKAKYMVLGYGLIEFFMGIQRNPGDNVAHFAHLGGMLFGFILLKIWSRNRKSFY